MSTLVSPLPVFNRINPSRIAKHPAIHSVAMGFNCFSLLIAVKQGTIDGLHVCGLSNFMYLMYGVIRISYPITA